MKKTENKKWTNIINLINQMKNKQNELNKILQNAKTEAENYK